MAVEPTIIGIFDRMAKVIQNAKGIASTGTDFWARVDAAQDESYENRIKGFETTTLDTVLENGFSISSVFQQLISNHIQYLRDIGITDSNALNAYLTAYSGKRIPYDAGELIAMLLGESMRLPAYQVYPKGTRPADGSDPADSGMHCLATVTGTTGAPTWATVDGAIDSETYGAIMLINDDATPAPNSLILTATRQDGTTVDITVALTATTLNAQSILGSQAIGAAGAAAGQKVIPVAATGQFNAGEYVLIVHNDSSQEIAQIASITTNTSITLETNLLNNYVQNDLVLPLFTNITYKSGTLADGKTISLWAYPDRIIAL